MDKPLLVLKPSIGVAILPKFLRNLLYTVPITLGIFGLYYVLRKPLNIFMSTSMVITIMIVIMLLISISPLIADIVWMRYTRYYFLRTHIMAETKIIKVRRQSVPYHQVVNITTHINLWNRMWDTGDVVIHTVEESIPDIVLKYVKDPHKIENSIYKMVHMSKGKQQ